MERTNKWKEHSWDVYAFFFLSYSVFITVAILKIIFQSLTQYNELKPS